MKLEKSLVILQIDDVIAGVNVMNIHRYSFSFSLFFYV